MHILVAYVTRIQSRPFYRHNLCSGKQLPIVTYDQLHSHSYFFSAQLLNDRGQHNYKRHSYIAVVNIEKRMI